MKTTSEIKNAGYYISKYEDRWNQLFNEAQIEGSNDAAYDATIMFDETANTEEIVGYYLVHHEWNPLGDWLGNIEGIVLTEQDKEVTKILTDLCK